MNAQEEAENIVKGYVSMSHDDHLSKGYLIEWFGDPPTKTPQTLADEIATALSAAHAAGFAEAREAAKELAAHHFIPNHSVAGPGFAAELCMRIGLLQPK